MLPEVRSPGAAGCGGHGAISDINTSPFCMYLNSMRFGAVPLVLLDQGELEPAEQIILNIDAES